MSSSLLNQMKSKEGYRRWDKDAIERQLAHADKDKIRGTYNHAEYIDERREMLQVWADYLDELRQGGQVLPFKNKIPEK